MCIFSGCPEPFADLGHGCYYTDMSQTFPNWDAARQACLNLGADLTIIKSQEEDEALVEYVISEGGQGL